MFNIICFSFTECMVPDNLESCFIRRQRLPAAQVKLLVDSPTVIFSRDMTINDWRKQELLRDWLEHDVKAVSSPKPLLSFDTGILVVHIGGADQPDLSLQQLIEQEQVNFWLYRLFP